MGDITGSLDAGTAQPTSWDVWRTESIHIADIVGEASTLAFHVQNGESDENSLEEPIALGSVVPMRLAHYFFPRTCQQGDSRIFMGKSSFVLLCFIGVITPL